MGEKKENVADDQLPGARKGVMEAVVWNALYGPTFNNSRSLRHSHRNNQLQAHVAAIE